MRPSLFARPLTLDVAFPPSSCCSIFLQLRSAASASLWEIGALKTGILAGMPRAKAGVSHRTTFSHNNFVIFWFFCGNDWGLIICYDKIGKLIIGDKDSRFNVKIIS